jgi:uncharacterized membrane protein
MNTADFYPEWGFSILWLAVGLICFSFPSLPPNDFIGIRVPATRNNPARWKYVHTKSSPWLVAICLVCAVLTYFATNQQDIYVILGGVTALCVVSFYFVYRSKGL